MRAAAIILAAGQGARYAASGGAEPSKLVALWNGMPLVRHVAEAALASKARPVIVVTGHAHAEVAAALAGLDVHFAHNPEFADGMAGSLRCGIAEVPPDAQAAVVLLADMPKVAAALIDQLADALAAHPLALAAAPVRNGQRGNPVCLSRALFAQVAALSGDQGARKLLDGLGGRLVEIDVDDDAVARDIDTSAALEALREASLPR